MEKRKIRTAVLVVKNNMLNWNSNRELDRASISNFKAPGLEIQKGNCSKLSFISDASDNNISCISSSIFAFRKNQLGKPSFADDVYLPRMSSGTQFFSLPVEFD